MNHAAMMVKANALMSDLVSSLALLEWSVLEPPPNEDEAVCYQGAGDGWIVTIIGWKLRDADGERVDGWGHDGTCVRDGMIVRLTREVAQKVFLHACRRG